MFSSDGMPRGANFKVNSDTGAYGAAPDIGSDYNGNFVITWRDRRTGTGNYDIYFQKYDSAGLAVGINQKVNSELLC